MKQSHRAFGFVLPLLALLSAVVLACSSSDAGPAPPSSISTPGSTPSTGANPSATATPSSEAAPAPTIPLPTVSPVVGGAEPDGERILEAVKTLADTVGPRVAGTDSEKVAAGLIADWLGQMGYEVRLQEFAIGTELGRSSALSFEDAGGAGAETIPTLPFSNSGTSRVSGDLVFAEAGRPEDFPAGSDGAIVVIQRDGVVFFNEKVANAVAAGAIGVVIYNNEPGILLGSLESPVAVPVVGISMAEGEDLVAALGEGELTADVSVGSLSGASSYNVIAEPAGKDCETVTGGHYDSVQVAPGASDNASGTAAVLEIAAVLAHNGEMGSHCFVLFGAEELGLLGSAYYVSQLTPEEKANLEAMLNLDMVGFGSEGWRLIGDGELQQSTISLAAELGIAGVVPGELIRGLSSDHSSFANAGIPVLMFHRWEDTLLHTPQDVSGRIEPQYLEEAARMSIALLHALEPGG